MFLLLSFQKYRLRVVGAISFAVLRLIISAHGNSCVLHCGLLQIVSPHLITLSALARTLSGIVRPICLAAFRLMMNSNFVGCSMGSSAGFRPFKILST